VALLDPHAREELADLADGVDGNLALRELLEVGARGRREREVTPTGRAPERPGRAGERPRDHPAHGVLPARQSPHLSAQRVELSHRDDVLVGGDLEDGVL